MNIKKMFDEFLYTHIDYYTKIISDGGEATEIKGIRVLDEQYGYTHGALIHATTILYLHYLEVGDERAEEALRRLLSFIDITSKRKSIWTWGKLGVLRALNKLHKANKLDVIGKERLDRLEYLTDYEDFLDKTTAKLKGAATNYYQVALACAAYRERLGFEDGTVRKAIEKRFIPIACPEGGFMDDEEGIGRFDRYSFIVSSELADLYFDLGLQLPKPISDNLKMCAEYALFMANEKGDGFNYGRSLSIHGDLAPVESLCSSLAHGLVDEKDIPLALAYTGCVLKKCFNYWLNKEENSFDLWWGGRTTNAYRQVYRILEVNMDIVCHLYALYKNLCAAGLANTEIPEGIIPSPDCWQVKRLAFSEKYYTFILRYRDNLVMLPFVRTNAFKLKASYNPFPALCGLTEGSPESVLPYLIPEYVGNDGEKYRPQSFVMKTEEKQNGDTLEIVAYGKLMRVSDLSESEYSYRQTVVFFPNSISVSFEINEPMQSASMLVAHKKGIGDIAFEGFTEARGVEILDNDDYKTPHGKYDKAFMCSTVSPFVYKLGYRVFF